MSARRLAAAALVAAAATARAHDLGPSVTFRSQESAVFTVSAAAPGVVYDSGVSDPIPEEWDTVLIQGESPDPAVVFEARRDGPSAAAWRRLEIHRFPGGRFWAKARLDRAAGPLVLRALDTGSRAGHRVEILGVEVFADEPAETESGPAAPAPPQPPSASRPLVHARAEWRAVPATRAYVADPAPWRVTLHHTDGRRTTTLADSEAEARFIQDFHIHGRGWIDIAYHFLVDASGNVIEGRPEGTLGSHTLHNNRGNVGIVLLGTYHPPRNDAPTQAQLDAVASLGRYLVARYGIAPSSLKGHRDYKATDCPGDLAYARLDALRLAFGGLPFPPRFASEPSWDGRPPFR